MGTGRKLAIAQLACTTMQLSVCWKSWNNGHQTRMWPRFVVSNEFSCEGVLISHECSCSGCSALDVGHYLHDCEEDSLS